MKVTITAKGYSSKEATFTERPKPKFTTSISENSLGADANEKVVLSFSSDDLVDGMDVTLELDGLRPENDLPTRAVTRYVYTVNGTGPQEIPLVTTESTTTSKTCYVQLKAEDFGFEDSQILSVVQSNTVTYSGTITVNGANLGFNNDDLETNYNYSSSATFSINVDGKEVDVSGANLKYKTNTNRTGNNWRDYKYFITGISEFSISDVSISGVGIDGNTNVEIMITITDNNHSRTVTYSSTIGNLGLTQQ